jgi:catechol 2,3-dioxygenase-like lactoylglutathione lyase family enzyme
MALTVEMVTIDCADPRALADFWTKALGYEVRSDYEAYVQLAPPAGAPGPRLGLQRVPEPKAGKNRVHLDMAAAHGDRQAEVDRLVGLGATVVDQQSLPGFAWTVLEDPEGNVFCVGAQA